MPALPVSPLVVIPHAAMALAVVDVNPDARIITVAVPAERIVAAVAPVAVCITAIGVAVAVARIAIARSAIAVAAVTPVPALADPITAAIAAGPDAD